MGRQQIYRGDPSLKQYYLINDFTGGINDTSVDERTETNEFRDLINVELSTKGMIQNRKGWGAFNLLNDLIAYKAEENEDDDLHLPYYNPSGANPVPTNRYALIKVVKNEGNILRVLRDYEQRNLSVSEFLLLDLQYTLEILMIYEDVAGIKLGLLTLTSLEDSEGDPLDKFEEIVKLEDGQLRATRTLTNIETVEYTDFIYFSLSKIRDGAIGFGEYNIAEKSYRVVNDLETETAFVYKPSPYEVSKVGFNILSNNPLTDIRKVEGFKSIQGVFLTTFELTSAGALVDTETPILFIPPNGEFTVNVIYTGTINLQDIELNFYTMGTDSEGLPIEIPVITNDNPIKATKIEAETGIARFAIKLPLQNKAEIYIRVKSIDGFILADTFPDANNTFATSTALLAYYNPTTATKFAVPLSSTQFALYNKTATAYTYELMSSYPYSGTNYSPIYNDANLSTTKNWVVSNITEYNSATSKLDQLTDTYEAFDAITVNTVPAVATSFSTGSVLKIQKTRLVTTPTATTTYTWQNATEQEFNNASSWSTISVTNDGCVTYGNVTTSNVSTYADIPELYTNGHIVRITSTAVFGGSTVNCGFKYFKATHTTTTSNSTTREFFSPATYKYFRVQAQIVGFTGNILAYNATEGKLYFRSGETRTEIASGIVQITSIAERTPNKTRKILIGTAGVPENYFQYNGGTAATIADFTNMVFVSSIDKLEYVDIYAVGINDNPKPVEQLDTKDFRILEIGSRLVLYKNNIIWFSDLYQFDYIPNYNYIILPLTPDDVITSINYFKGSYMIFTKERIYKMSGTFAAQDFQIQIVSDAIGCISPFSVKAFNNTLVFMTRDGLYRLKQNYYLGGLENVEKIDKQISNIVPTKEDIFSVLYNEQYMLFYRYTDAEFTNAPFNVVKMYYNMSAPQGFPFVKDKHSFQPPIVAVFDDELVSIENGVFYLYDLGYTDFLPPGIVDEDTVDNFKYRVKILTPNLFFNYPTHDKKFKAVFVKTNTNAVVPLYFNIYIDNILVYKHTDFQAVRQPDGTLNYELVDIANLTIGNPGLLGDYDLGIDKIGDYSTQVHKIVIAGKGKTIRLDIGQDLDKYFGIQDIGYLYKMGKAREDR
jgi:hypothetical protein